MEKGFMKVQTLGVLHYTVFVAFSFLKFFTHYACMSATVN